jgi:purine-binding chemotaxis protein CheW
MNAIAAQDRTGEAGAGTSASGACEEQMLRFLVGAQACCIPVTPIRDILASFELSRVPLAPADIAGNLNLRGRIVTAIDLRRRLAAEPDDGGSLDGDRPVAIVVEHSGTLYAMLVDRVDDVIRSADWQRHGKPVGLPRPWTAFVSDVLAGEQDLLARLDLDLLLAFDEAAR